MSRMSTYKSKWLLNHMTRVFRKRPSVIWALHGGDFIHQNRRSFSDDSVPLPFIVFLTFSCTYVGLAKLHSSASVMVLSSSSYLYSLCTILLCDAGADRQEKNKERSCESANWTLASLNHNDQSNNRDNYRCIIVTIVVSISRVVDTELGSIC